MDNNIIKKKSAGITAVLGNNNLSGTIKEALDSPFGSTKRKKASSILRAINAGNNDGMGGGLDENVSYSPDTSIKTTTPETMLKPPTPAAPPKIGLSETSPEIVTPATSSVQVFPAAPKLKVGVGVLPDFSLSDEKWAGMSESEKEGFGIDLPGKIGIGTNGEALPEYNGQLGSLEGPEAQKSFETPQAPQTPQTVSEVESFLTDVDESYIKSWYQGLSGSEQKRWKPLYEASEAGVGAKTFAWNIMQDTAALKQLFPNIPEDALPQGASLAGQLQDVENTIRDEFKIDDLKNNLDQKIEAGVTIEDDMTDYITARDTYIERLDGMIGTAKDSIVGMDMANPYIAKKMNGYMNYLYIMKGRQQKTYTDFLNSGIKQYNQQLKTSENLYNNAYDRFERAVANKQDVTREEHTMMTGMLEDMYANIEGREKTQLQMELLRNDVMQERYQTVSDSISSLSGGDDFKLTTTSKTSSQSNFLKENPDKKIGDWNALSNEEKLSYLDEDGEDNSAVDSYAMEIIRAKQGKEPSILYNEKKDIIDWNKISQGQRDDVRARYNEIIREAIAKKKASGTGEEKKSIFDKIRSLIGGGDDDEVNTEKSTNTSNIGIKTQEPDKDAYIGLGNAGSGAKLN